jgi:hypothetical protein
MIFFSICKLPSENIHDACGRWQPGFLSWFVPSRDAPTTEYKILRLNLSIPFQLIFSELLIRHDGCILYVEAHQAQDLVAMIQEGIETIGNNIRDAHSGFVAYCYLP